MSLSKNSVRPSLLIILLVAWVKQTNLQGYFALLGQVGWKEISFLFLFGGFDVGCLHLHVLGLAFRKEASTTGSSCSKFPRANVFSWLLGFAMHNPVAQDCGPNSYLSPIQSYLPFGLSYLALILFYLFFRVKKGCVL